MNLAVWGMIGLIIGVLSTVWQPKLSGRILFLEMCIGVIGAISGGVVGYVFYGSTLGSFNVSVFVISLIITVLAVIIKKKIRNMNLRAPRPHIEIQGLLSSLLITHT